MQPIRNYPSLLFAAGLLAATLPAAARANIVVVAPTATAAGSFTITAPVTFTATANGVGRIFVLDEWVTSDGTRTFSPFTPDLFLSLNGGAPTSYGNGSFVDNAASAGPQISANDGYFYTNTTFTLAPGDTVTLRAATYSLSVAPGFNPLAAQSFSGNMFITDDVGNQLTNAVAAGAVPEPSTCALALGGALGLFGVVRRRRGAANPCG